MIGGCGNTNHHSTVVYEHKFVDFIYLRCGLDSEYSTSFSIVCCCLLHCLLH